MSRFRLVICGAGVAGVEALLRVRTLVGDRIDITVLSAADHLAYLPLTVLQPFAPSRVRRYPLAPIVAETAAEWIAENLRWVDLPGQRVHTDAGRELAYDALVLAVGGRQRAAPPNVSLFSDRDAGAGLRAALSGAGQPGVGSVVFAAPCGASWLLPLCEIALLTAGLPAGRRPADLAYVTAERRPLAIFGDEVGDRVQAMLEQRGVAVHSGCDWRVPTPGVVELDRTGRRLRAERVISLPTITGPNVAGIPGEARDRFVPVDSRCRVRGGAGRVFAAGDATALPIKHGGLAAQQADTAAAGVAHLAGLAELPAPCRPVICASLLGGPHPLHLRAHVIAGRAWRTEVFEDPPWPGSEKLVAAELGPYLLAHGSGGRHR